MASCGGYNWLHCTNLYPASSQVYVWSCIYEMTHGNNRLSVH